MDWLDAPMKSGLWWRLGREKNAEPEMVDYDKKHHCVTYMGEEVAVSLRNHPATANAKWLPVVAPPARPTLAQQMAYAVLQGDEVAALALADLLQEQRATAALEAP